MRRNPYFQITGLGEILRGKPCALADICGSCNYPEINGKIQFYQTRCGVLVTAEICGLPTSHNVCRSGVYAFHIHEGKSCTGDADDPFANAKTHYNKCGCEHPYHSGDMPPLFSNNGYALSAFLTDRFSVDEVIGKTVIIHSDVDDFISQPAGNAGKKIACGVVKKVG